MIIVKTTKPIKAFITALRAKYASANHQDHNGSEGNTQITKHNPLREKDLRGYEQFSQLTDKQKSYSPLHITSHDPFSLYSLSSKLTNNLARLLGKLVSHPKQEIASDYLYLPKIYQNSISVYDSINKASTSLAVNKLITKVSPMMILLFSVEPTLSLITYGLLFTVYYQAHWNTLRHLVIKCQLVPQTEEIAYQKVTIWGTIVTKTAKISDLQYLQYSQVFKENDLSERSVRGILNRSFVFRVKGTKELLLFDRDGIWNEEGIHHELLY